MPTFEWKGTARNGQVQTGVLVAESKDSVINMMRRQQIVVTAVKEKGKELAIPKFGGKVPPQLIAIFTRQFSVMIDAGLPLVQCLEILANQQENKAFKRALIQIRQDVESGSNLADSMRKHPKIFNDLFTNMVAAGEAGGILDTILQRLATYIEKAVKLNGQVKSAMIYPVAVILHRRDRRGHHSLEGHPGLRLTLRRSRRRAADADAYRHRHVALHRRLLVADRHRDFLDDLRHPPLSRDGKREARPSTDCCSRCRSSACSFARSPWPVSAARSPR